jgi:hypothetical protein
VAAFDRVPETGAPARKAGRDACTSPDGSGGACRAGAGITGAADLALAPDGAQVSTAAFRRRRDRRRRPPAGAAVRPGAASVGNGGATVLALSCIARGAPVTSVPIAARRATGRSAR